jgi:hypothetical protein
MPNPTIPERQSLMWHSESHLYNIIGSVSDGLYVLAKNDASTASTMLFLFSGSTDPQILFQIPLRGGWYYEGLRSLRGESGTGVVGFIARHSGTGAYRIYRVFHSGSTISFASSDIPSEHGQPISMCASTDGGAFFVQFSSGPAILVRRYDATSVASTDVCTVSEDSTRSYGYLAGSPSLNQFIWVNKSSPSILYYITGVLVSSGVVDTPLRHSYATYSYDLSEVVGTVILASVNSRWSYGGIIGSGPTDGYGTTNGIVAPGNLGADVLGTGGTAYFTGYNWEVSFGADFGGALSSAYFTADWSGAGWNPDSSFQWVEVSNGDQNGGHIELRSPDGLVLSYVVADDPFLRGGGEWVGSGSGSITYLLSLASGGT